MSERGCASGDHCRFAHVQATDDTALDVPLLTVLYAMKQRGVNEPLLADVARQVKAMHPALFQYERMAQE